jgi:transposase InsO family protein
LPRVGGALRAHCPAVFVVCAVDVKRRARDAESCSSALVARSAAAQQPLKIGTTHLRLRSTRRRRPAGGHWIGLEFVPNFALVHDDGRRVLICDRDAKWSRAVRGRFQDAEIRLLRTPYRAPNANAYAERFVRSSKRSV